MLLGVVRGEGGGSVLPFVRQFHGSPSTCWWDDDEGVTHEIVQGEGGEQGDSLMPALYALGQHRALVAGGPLRVADIQVHHGKTQLWIRGGEGGVHSQQQLDPDPIVWRGDPELLPSEQGVKVLGAPLGHPGCGLSSGTLEQPTGNCWSGSRRSPICRVRGWCCSFTRVLGLIICSERSLRIVRKTSQLNTTVPCAGASPNFWDVTCPTPRGTSLSCFSPLGVLVCAVHVE